MGICSCGVNRTTVELKLGRINANFCGMLSVNRTTVELKLNCF